MSEPSRTRRLLIFGAKLAVGAVLIGWLIRSKTLDFGALALFFERPSLLAADLLVFALSVLFAALRWRLLLRLADVHLSFGRALQLTMTGLFFNVVFPGNIGGDVIKAIYVARDVAPERRTSVFVIGFLDRLLALAGLVAVAGILTLARGRVVWEDARLRQLSTAVVALVFVTLIAPALMIIVVRRAHGRLERWGQGPSRLSKIFAQLLASARLVSANPRALLAALGLAIATHLLGILLFATLATAILDQSVSIMDMASVYPLGILTMALPISYAGIGVGHVAFQQLFEIVGLTGGATVLNVYLIGQSVPCLFGVLPYLLLRRTATPPTVTEVPSEPTEPGS